MVDQVEDSEGQAERDRWGRSTTHRQTNETPMRVYRSKPYRRLLDAYIALRFEFVSAGGVAANLPIEARIPSIDEHNVDRVMSSA